MKISTLQKSYKFYIARLMNEGAGNEVYTTTELRKKCKAKGYACTDNGIWSYIQKRYPSVKINNERYFGNEKSIKRLQKLINGEALK